jgi:hypothetical protein
VQGKYNLGVLVLITSKGLQFDQEWELVVEIKGKI